MNRKDEAIVLCAKTINGRYCDPECAFITEFKGSNYEICYACSLFGGLNTEVESINLNEEEETDLCLSWVDLPVRSPHCTRMVKHG